MSNRTKLVMAVIVVLVVVVGGVLVYRGARPELVGVFIAMLAAISSMVGVVVTWMTVQEMKLAREAQERPYVILDFDLSESHIINLVVSNIGSGAAKDVRFSFKPDLVASDGRNISASVLLFRQGASFFPPGKTISQFFDVSLDYFAADKPLTFDVMVSYRDATGGKGYKDSLRLDLPMFKGRMYVARKGVHDLVKEIEKLRKTTDNLVNNTNSIAARLDSGVRLSPYGLQIIPRTGKQALLSKLMEFHNVWTHIYAGSPTPYMKLDEVQGRCLSLGYEIVYLASACRDLDNESSTQILQIASRISDLSNFRFLADGGEATEQFNSQGQEILSLIQGVKSRVIEGMGT